MNSYMVCYNRINAAYKNLTPSEEKIADYILNKLDPEEDFSCEQ